MSLALGFSPRFAVYIVLRCVARPEYLIRRYATRRSCDTVQFTPDFSQGLKLGSSFNPSSRFQHLDVTTQQAAEQRTELSPGRVCEPWVTPQEMFWSCGAAIDPPRSGVLILAVGFTYRLSTTIRVTGCSSSELWATVIFDGSPRTPSPFQAWCQMVALCYANLSRLR